MRCLRFRRGMPLKAPLRQVDEKPEADATLPDARVSAPRGPGRRSKAQERDRSERLRDRVSKDCLLLQDAVKLSNRETEVAELIMRGNSVSSIAETLVILREHGSHAHEAYLYEAGYSQTPRNA